jgi:hypothetical protein
MGVTEVSDLHYGEGLGAETIGIKTITNEAAELMRVSV